MSDAFDEIAILTDPTAWSIAEFVANANELSGTPEQLPADFHAYPNRRVAESSIVGWQAIHHIEPLSSIGHY